MLIITNMSFVDQEFKTISFRGRQINKSKAVVVRPQLEVIWKSLLFLYNRLWTSYVNEPWQEHLDISDVDFSPLEQTIFIYIIDSYIDFYNYKTLISSAINDRWRDSIRYQKLLCSWQENRSKNNLTQIKYFRIKIK